MAQIIVKITMLVTPARPSFVTRVPSFLQTTRQGMPDTPVNVKFMIVGSIATTNGGPPSSQLVMKGAPRELGFLVGVSF